MKEAQIVALARQKLAANCDPAFREFVKPFIRTPLKIVGVRIPILHSIAKEIARTDAEGYLKERPDQAFEETVLRGLVIAYAKSDNTWRLNALKAFIPRVQDWAACDVVCAALKPLRKEREAFLAFLEPYLCSKSEFEARFAIVSLMDHFLTPEYIGTVFAKIKKVDDAPYSVMMGQAWIIATAARKFPKETVDFLKKAKLSEETKKAALRKIKDSRAVMPEVKRVCEMILKPEGKI